MTIGLVFKATMLGEHYVVPIRWRKIILQIGTFPKRGNTGYSSLATQEGGKIVLDPGDSARQRTLQNLLHLDLRLEKRHVFETIGD